MNEVKTATVVRTALLVLALTNQILTATGHSVIPVSDEQLTQIISLGFTVVTSLWAWWKNNSFTRKAIEADKVLDESRKGE